MDAPEQLTLFPMEEEADLYVQKVSELGDPTQYPKVVALVSPHPQCGKSTFADYLVEAHGYTRIKLADPLKDMLRSLLSYLGCNYEAIEAMVEGRLKERPIPILGDKTPRQLLITLGTAWGRNLVCYDMWTNIAQERIRRVIDRGGRVVVDDVRFPNEMNLVKSFNTPLLVYIRRGGSTAHSGNPTEGNIPPEACDVVVENNDTIEMLQWKAEGLMREWSRNNHREVNS